MSELAESPRQKSHDSLAGVSQRTEGNRMLLLSLTTGSDRKPVWLLLEAATSDTMKSVKKKKKTYTVSCSPPCSLSCLSILYTLACVCSFALYSGFPLCDKVNVSHARISVEFLSTGVISVIWLKQLSRKHKKPHFIRPFHFSSSTSCFVYQCKSQSPAHSFRISSSFCCPGFSVRCFII